MANYIKHASIWLCLVYALIYLMRDAVSILNPLQVLSRMLSLVFVTCISVFSPLGGLLRLLSRVFIMCTSCNRAKTGSKMKRCLSTLPPPLSLSLSLFPLPISTSSRLLYLLFPSLFFSFSRHVLCACSPRCNVHTIVPGRVACECIM